MPCSLVYILDECTASIFVGQRISKACNQQEADGGQSLCFDPEKGGNIFP
jgi:hypothetical protein